MRLLRRASGALLDLVLPEYCVVCRREGSYLCDDCDSDLLPLQKPYCFVCASPRVPQLCEACRRSAPAFDSVRAPYVFHGSARRIVHDLKYRYVRIAAPHMARLLAEYLERNPYPVDALCPVPLHSRRERSRGFNQSELIARKLSELTGVPIEDAALRRTRNTPPQVSVESPEDRQRNTEDAFECLSDLGGHRYMLIDDVVTTGSTMSACADALKNAGAANVWGLASRGKVICRARMIRMMCEGRGCEGFRLPDVPSQMYLPVANCSKFTGAIGIGLGCPRRPCRCMPA